MTSLTETIEYTPRNDWGALPWGSVETWAWGGREVADAREVADWIVGKGPSDLLLLDGKVLLRGQVRIPDTTAPKKGRTPPVIFGEEAIEILRKHKDILRLAMRRAE